MSAVRDEFQAVFAVEIEHRCGRLFDGPPCHVDCRPTPLCEQAARRGDLLGDRDTVDIIGLRVGVERKKPVLPDLHNSISRSNKPDNQWAAKMVDCSWQWQARHNGDVRSLISTIGEIDAGRGLRSAANPK